MSYKLGSLFDGSGGFPLAGSLCGIEPVWASEVEPYPIAVTRSRFPRVKHLGDISKIHGGEIEPVDIITFGSPCQDLSVAGKRAGLKHQDNGDDETTRSGLFMEAVRIIKEMREATNGMYPRFALWENVPGAFSSNKGEDFRLVCEELIKIVEPTAVMPAVPQNGWSYADSYCGDGWSLAYRVFDAQYWGVPQRRRRIHLVADFRGECAREVLFEREGLRGYFAQSGAQRQGAASDAENGSRTDDRTGEITGSDGGRELASVAYSFDSLASNSMKSSNPHSGCRQVEIAKTLDTTDPNPCKNQGGIAIVEALPEVLNVEMEVATRKHEVDRERLSTLLRDHKGAWTNRALAEELGKPETEVAHWFRADDCFSIPDPDIWHRLKKLLQISTTEFDAAVTEFEFKGGNYDMRNRIYTGDVAPTLTCGSGNNLHLLPERPSPVIIDSVGGQAERAWEGETAPTLKASHFKCPPLVTQAAGFCTEHSAKARGVGFQEEVAPTLRAGVTPACVYEWHNQDSRIRGPIPVGCTLNTHAGGREGHLVVEPVVYDGANITSPINAANPQPGDPCHTLNTDSRNYLVESQQVFCLQGNGIDRADTAGCNGKGWKEDSSYTLNTIDRPAVAYATDVGFFNSQENVSPTLLARMYKDPHLVTFEGQSIQYIVRRLTPTECARLQGFADRWGHPDRKDKLTDAEYEFWLTVRNTHAEINGRAAKKYTKAQMLKWYNGLHTDSSEYKMWGNGIALPPALYCMQGFVDVLTKEVADAWLL